MPDDVLSEDQIRGLLREEPQFNVPDPLQAAARQQAAGAEERQLGRERSPASYKENLINYNQVPGVPLDVETGAPTWQRLKGSFASSPELTVKFWQDLYGTQNVRQAMFQGRPTGGLIIRTQDEKTKKPRDILVDEENFSFKDLADMAGATPELAGGIASTILAKRARPGVGLYGAARNIVSAGVGAETVGFLKDLSMGANADNAFNERFHALQSDLKWGPIFDILGRGLGRVITPISKEPGPIYKEGQSASDYFQGRFGVGMPYSTAEKTEVPIFQRTEVEMKRLPGGGGAYADLRAEQQANAQKIMNRVQGLSTDADSAERAGIPSEEEIGRQAIAEMQSKNQSIEDAVRTARTRMLDQSQGLIARALNQAGIAERQLYSDLPGKAVRNRALYERGQFQSEVNRLYDAAKSLPGGQDRILITPGLPNEAKGYLKTLPSKEKILETIDYDQYGSPILRTTTGSEVMKEFIPSNVVGKLNELATVGKTEWSLQDLIAMRNEVSNDIAQGEAIPGVQTYHLKKIRDMLTGAIQESTSAIPDKELRNAWQRANGYYAKNVEKFHTKLVAGLLKSPSDPGYIGPDKLAQNILKGADNIMEAKTFLGAASREYLMLKQHLADHIYQNSLKSAGRLDAGKFINDLRALRKSNRRVYDEVFGRFGEGLIEQASQMSIGEPTRYGAAAAKELEASFIDAGISDPSRRASLRTLIQSQAQQDAIYQNQIRKAIGSRNVPGTLNAGEFVQKFLRAPGKGGASPEEARQAMALLSPEMQTRVQSKLIENILEQASRSPTEVDQVALRLDPHRVINSEALLKILGNAENQRMFENVIGPVRYKDVVSLAQMMRPIEQKQAAYAGAAGLAAGAAVSGFLSGSVMRFAKKATVHKLISALLTAEPTRMYLEQSAEPISAGLRLGARNIPLGQLTLTPERRATFLATIVGSEPFWKNLVEDYGEAGAKKMMRLIANDLNIPTQPQQGQPQSEEQIRQLLRQ